MPYSATPICNMNAAEDAPTGRVTERDLNARQAERVVHLHRATVLPLLPAGCDQQGRHAMRQAMPAPEPAAPVPAEAATELGAEDHNAPRGPRQDRLLIMLLGSVVSVCIIAALAAMLP